MIDDHPLELKAMELFKQGRAAEAHRAQDEFVQAVRDSGEDHCSCPTSCKLHGKCVECVIVHRGHGDHLPHCFHSMVNRGIEAVSALTEHSIKRQPDDDT